MSTKIDIKLNMYRFLGGVVVFLSALFLLAGNVSAQGINVLSSKYSTILFDSSSGLPTSEASAIAQTSDGFIWIGSYSGLIRYNGKEFERYGAEAGIKSVSALFADTDGRLFIGTPDSGVYLYEKGEFSAYGAEAGLGSLSVNSIAEDNAKNIIVATENGISYLDTEYAVHALSDERIDSETVTMLKASGDGAVYGVTESGSLFVIEKLKVSYFKQDQGGAKFTCVYPDSDKNVYLGTSDSEIIYGSISDDLKNTKKYSVDPLSGVKMVHSNGMNVWVCADNGIGYFDGSNRFHLLKNSPLSNSVDYMIEDYENNLWFTSSRQGVMELTTSPFVDISGLAGLASRVVNTTCMYKGDLYIGTDTGLIILNDELDLVQNNLTARFDGTKINCIKTDSNGNIWFCTSGENGLAYFDGSAYIPFTESDGLKSNNVRTLCELKDKRIAVAAGGGITIIKNKEIERTFGVGDGLPGSEILTICDGGDGKVYLGSNGDGIFVLEGNAISKLDTAGLNSDVILKIKKDPDKNILWIITSISVSYMENGKINTVTSFPYSNNYDMYFSKNNELWVLSSNGIYVTDKDVLTAGEEPEYRFYNHQSGMPSMTTADSSSFLDEDGTLYIAGNTGVSSICIDEPDEAAGDIKLAIPYIEADDKMIAINGDERIVIPSDTKRLTIYSYALTYSLHNPQVSYRLEGFDEDEVFTTVRDLGPTTYTNLKGGEYKFTLSVYNNRTGQKEKTAVLITYKEKAFYEKPVFWVVGVVLLLSVIALLGYLYFRYKTMQMVKKQEETKIYLNQMISAFAKTIDIKDKYTNGHSFRVAQYSKMIAEKMNYSKDEVDKIYHIALLHDVGKITVPDEILRKPGKLTEEEYGIIKQHAVNGYNILKEIEISPDLALGAGFHHERVDGKGYPSGMTGDEIPMIAQIIAVADMFDAMNSTRPYRKKVKMEEIEAELKRVSGTQLNADIVKVLLKLIDEYAFENV